MENFFAARCLRSRSAEPARRHPKRERRLNGQPVSPVVTLMDDHAPIKGAWLCC